MQAKKYVIIDWQPSRQARLSLVDQIVSYFKQQVSKGNWLCGDHIPSQRELATVFSVNRSTIVTALSILSADGIIESTVGRGTIISNNSWSFLFSKATPDWDYYIQQGFHKSNLPTIQAINKFEFDPDIIRLSTGEISEILMPHEAISSVLIELSENPKAYSYLEPLGLYELRLALCQYLKRYNLNVDPSEILIVSGSLQALQLISLSLLGKHSTVFVEDYSYVKSLKVFEFSSISMAPVPTDKNGPIPWLIDTSKTDGPSILYTIPTFHNPTGVTMNIERREELLNWCRNNNFPIIEDDAYRELHFEDLPPRPIKSFDDSGNVLYLGSVSKSLAPGFRIGWVIGPSSIIERLGDIKMQTDYGASSISQWLLTKLIEGDHYESHLNKLRTSLKVRCDFMLALLNKYFGDIATWNNPKGGFYIWLRFNEPICTKKLFDLALEHKILINPGYIYGFKENHHLRLSYCYSSHEEMRRGLKVLSELAHQLIGS